MTKIESTNIRIAMEVETLTAGKVCYHSANQFDVSFPEKPLKIVATRGEIFSLKFTKYCLADHVTEKFT